MAPKAHFRQQTVNLRGHNAANKTNPGTPCTGTGDKHAQ
jgi:hypothetical protein